MIEIHYKGRLGNNIFQYCLGRIIALRFGYAVKISNGQHLNIMPEIDGKKVSHPVDLIGNKNHYVIINGDHDRKFVLSGFYQRYEYYKDYKDSIKNWIKLPSVDIDLPDKDDLVLHVRGGDLWGNKNHPVNEHHTPAPYFYYKQIIENFKGNNIYIVTEKSDDIVIKKIQDNFNCKVISRSPIEDFIFMMNASEIALSVSTLSWWAAWLSNAYKVHFPKFGMWHPDTGSDVDLHVDESRYVYHEIGKMNTWSASEEQKRMILSDNNEF
ncbi:MAG: hypothetical protein BAJALOKI3v1_50078 [Promethearchaeota archaeon]|nr:MAG: hypothetical protein BAJALOKI3v1_50078 [Candidatus Lokiarchaeota archaeon]